MRRDCPCYQSDQPCECECCTGIHVSILDNDLSCINHDDEHFCECHSNEYIMQVQNIDPALAKGGRITMYTSTEPI